MVNIDGLEVTKKGYARVSSANQHEDRQLIELIAYGVPERNIYIDKQSGKDFNFSPLRIMFAVGLSYIAFIMLRYVPSIPAFWRVFIINGC